MAKLNKFSNNNFECESINELLEFNTGITNLFKAAFSRWNYQPEFTAEECRTFETVLNTQQEAQEVIAKRVKKLLPNYDFDNRHDTL